SRRDAPAGGGAMRRRRLPTEPARASHPTPDPPRPNPMIHTPTIDTLAQRLASLLPPGLREAREDLTANFRDTLRAGLRELDLVTREEFDVQRCVLLRTREKIEELERQVDALERRLAGDTAPRN